MRIGPDQWGETGFENIASRYYEHGKWWLNDPDALVGSDSPVEEYRAWTTLVGVSGSVITIGDDLWALPAEKLHILKRIHPTLGISGRPVDLFRGAPGNMWLLETKGLGAKSAVVALFNWANKEPVEHKFWPGGLLRMGKSALVYDFWDDLFVGRAEGEMTFTVPYRSVKVLCLAAPTGAPQVLAVSNHLSQMEFGLKNVVWSPNEATLRGETTGVVDDAYHIAVYVPTGYAVVQGEVDGKAAFLVKADQNVWLIPVNGTNRLVEWSVKFRPPAAAHPG
jgi:hypothetical protein